MRSLLKRSDTLCQEARGVMRRTKIRQILSHYPTYSVIGSTKLKVMHKPDIDIRICVDELVSVASKRLAILIESTLGIKPVIKDITPEFTGISVVNYLNKKTGTKKIPALLCGDS